MMSAYSATAPITQQASIFPQPITALCFDPLSDTLWTGTNAGSVVATYTSRGMRGVVFPVGGEFATKRIVATENTVLAIGGAGEGVGCWSKGGVNKWYFRSAATATTFSNISGASQLLACSTVTPELIFLNSFSGSEARRVSCPTTLTHLQFSGSNLLSGGLDGFLRSHDPRTGLRRSDGGAELSVRAHTSGFQGLQTSGHYVYSIGWSLRQSRPFPEPMVKIHDMRTMRPIAPLPFSEGPAFISILPKHSSSIVVTSNQGLINIVDVGNPGAASEFHQLDTASYVTSAAVSPTGAYLAFGDGEGIVHMLTSSDPEHPVPLNGFEGKPIEWVDRSEPVPEVEWTENTPLNAIGMPHYDTPLLSSWTAAFLSADVGCPPPAKIPASVLNGIKTNANLAYAALPKELRGKRNVVQIGPKKNQARFRSGKMQRRVSEPETPGSETEIPKCFRKVEIEYSKFGVEDFDFAYYNRTDFSGLESHILNSYTNSIVQVLHYIQPVRRLAKSHITTECPHEHCLLCELGFVFRMLEDARGTNCQASNFCKTVGVLAQVNNQIELVDYGRDAPDIDYGSMIQSFNRFLIDRLSADGYLAGNLPQLVPPSSTSSGTQGARSPVTQLVGIEAQNVVTCRTCNVARSKDNLTHILDLVYPRAAIPGQPPPSLGSVLQESLARQMTHKAVCASCKKFSTFDTKRSFVAQDLPSILAVNTCVFNDETLKFWQDGRKHRFLEPTVTIYGEGDDQPVIYALRGMVVQIMDKGGTSHLTAVIKVPEAEGDMELFSPWVVFNDFVVTSIPEQDALSFPDEWKIPTVLYMERLDAKDKINYGQLPDNTDPQILCRDISLSVNRDPSLIKHELLRPEELPKPGTLVSIDAEFVEMQQEETEYRSDGSKTVFRPARLSLARVSVLRGDGPKEGVPFIDDHIHTSEMIVNYLTEFSGIQFGDLDPMLSRHTLTPLKLVYKKLRLLVDSGCIFIGHGLSKDFRIINIFVPPEQVIDTVDLYFIRSRQRRLSLRFLTWAVLEEQIQQDMHDSIEDARSALRLYKKYHEFEEERIFDKKLEEVYKIGKENNWKPPGVSGVTSRAASPPTVPGHPSMHAVPFFSPVGMFPGSPAMSPFANVFPNTVFAPGSPMPNVFSPAIGAPNVLQATSPFGAPGSPGFFQPNMVPAHGRQGSVPPFAMGQQQTTGQQAYGSPTGGHGRNRSSRDGNWRRR